MTHVCIGGGSIKGFSYLGVLHYLFSNNIIKKITKLHACSIGSLITIIIIMGISPINIFEDMLKTDLSTYWDLDVNRITTEFSILGRSIFNFWIEYITKYIDPNTTIKDFSEKYEVDINIITTCLNSRQTVIMNKNDYPDVKIVDALIASSSIPFLFPPYKINDKYYVDGAVKCLSGCFNETINDDTILIKIKDNDLQGEEHLDITSFKDYAFIILKTMTSPYIIPKEPTNTFNIVIPKKFNQKYNFNDLTIYDKTELFYIGIKNAIETLKSISENN